MHGLLLDYIESHLMLPFPTNTYNIEEYCLILENISNR